MKRHRAPLLGPLLLAGALAIMPSLAQAGGGSYLGQFNLISTVASTVPANGDVNPYGIAVVPASAGKLSAGSVLISNFNSSANLQGTGTTIVQITPKGAVSLFAKISANGLPGPCPGGVGLTTALGILPGGWVVVGSLPTTDGTAATAKAGCLLVLNSNGQVVETIAGPKINGPWDMATVGSGYYGVLFVTNVLNGTVAGGGHVVNGGTVVRIVLRLSSGKPQVLSETVIGSRFPERSDPAALVIGPTGAGVGSGGTLYVADSLDNRIAAISKAFSRTTSALTGTTVTTNGALNDPLGMTIAPNGDVLTVNGNDGNAVETTPAGTQVMTKTLDATGSPPGAGTLFGLTIIPGGKGLYFVDDGSNTLNALTAGPQAAVTIQNFSFNPMTITVKLGTTITWTNKDLAVPHTVTADNGSFTSAVLQTGGTFSHTFTSAGTITYHCMIHPFMHGAVVVTP